MPEKGTSAQRSDSRDGFLPSIPHNREVLDHFSPEIAAYRSSHEDWKCKKPPFYLTGEAAINFARLDTAALARHRHERVSLAVLTLEAAWP